MMKWVEVKALWDNTIRSTIKFLYENSSTHLSCPTHLVSGQGNYFMNNYIKLLVQEFMITHHKSTTYCPQGNGQAKSTNKTLKQILIRSWWMLIEMIGM
jgi:hypothetical protein